MTTLDHERLPPLEWPDYGEPMLEAIRKAYNAACRSLCGHSRRGAVAFPCASQSRYAPEVGTNGPPKPFVCDRTQACAEACGRICNHAEERVVLAWLRHRSGIPFDVLHLKVDPALHAVPSGPPSCVTCSRLILEASHLVSPRVERKVWLWHADGWRSYTPFEFHRETLRTLGLPSTTGDACLS